MTATVADRIRLYEEVREIPYRYDFVRRDADATCLTKAELICGGLEAMGIQTRIICCSYAWEETPFPLELIALSPQSGTDVRPNHFYAQALIPETNRWADVDPTFDSALRGAGFTVASWDGLNSTPLAVRKISDFSAEISESIRQSHRRAPPAVWRDMQVFYGDFYGRINAWLEQNRRLPVRNPIRAPLETLDA